MKKALFVAGLLTALSVASVSQATITVVNTNADGPGSFVQALLDVDSGGTILFDAALGSLANIDINEVDLIDKDVTIDNSGGHASFSVESGAAHYFEIDGATVQFMDVVIDMSGSAYDLFLGIKNGGHLMISGGSFEFGEIDVTDSDLTIEDSHFPMEDATDGAIRSGGSSAVKISNTDFRWGSIWASGGTFDVVGGKVQQDDIPGPTFVNLGASVTVTGTFVDGRFANQAGDFTFVGVDQTDKALSSHILWHSGGSGTIIQSGIHTVDQAIAPTVLYCEAGDLTILNSEIWAIDPLGSPGEAIESTENCQLDIYSSIIGGLVNIPSPVSAAKVAVEAYNLMYDPNVNPEANPYNEDNRLLPNSPAIDQGDCSRITMTEDFDGAPRLWDAPSIADAPGGDGCDIGRYERQSLLPVELTSFEVAMSGDQAVLEWEVASQTDNAGFEIEKHRVVNDTDWLSVGYIAGDSHWTNIGFVPGDGTLTESRTFSFSVGELEVGNHLFRLKQIDFSGAYEYSNVAFATVFPENLHVLADPYPNPARDRINFTLASREEGTIRVEFFDALGRQMNGSIQRHFIANERAQIEVDASGWSPGLYVYRISTGPFVRTGTVVKE